jgi:hypothetical protein
MAKRRVGVEYSPSMLEPVRLGAASRDRALCLPTFSHFLIVNKTSLSLSLSFSFTHSLSLSLSLRLSRSLSSLVVHLDIGGTWIAKIKVLKDHAKIGDLTLALAGRWRPLWARAGRGGSGRALGLCGCAVASLLRRGCGGAVCWRPAIGLPAQSVVVGEGGAARGCGGGRAAAWASTGRGQLQQECGFTAV